MKKLIVDANRENICELAHLALEKQGINSSVILDENNQYVVRIDKINKIWKGEEDAENNK